MENVKTSRSVERALTILRTLAQEGGPLGISELARRTGCSKSTVHLSLQTMRAMKFVEQDPTSGYYVLGLAAAQLGAAATDSSRLVEALSGPMHDLATLSAEAVSLGVRTGGEVTFVKRVETAHVLRTGIREGTSMPLHASACGKALLTGLTDDEIVQLFPDERIPYHARGTETTRADLLAEVREARRLGYATSHDEFVDGVSAAAAPVVIGGRVVAAVSIAGPTTRFRANLWTNELRRLVNAPALDADDDEGASA